MEQEVSNNKIMEKLKEMHRDIIYIKEKLLENGKLNVTDKKD